jgi:D-alanine-D-alanine ligase
MKILVLHSDIPAGAPPEEQDTLIASQAVAAALAARGHQIRQAPFAADRLAQTVAGADMVFNLVEGIEGKGALAPLCPKLLERMGMPYTGVGADAMDLTNDKVATKRKLREAGLPTPDWSVPPDWAGLDEGRWIVKSALEDASIGLDDGCVVGGSEVAARAASSAKLHGGAWFAERFIEGREFNIALLNGKVLPLAEMCFEAWPQDRPRIVGYAAKWDDGSHASRHTVRRFGVERHEPELAAAIRTICEKVWPLFGLTGFARVDFRVDEGGAPSVLEINANPGISPDAGFAAAAAEAGMSYEDLIEAIVKAAL